MTGVSPPDSGSTSPRAWAAKVLVTATVVVASARSLLPGTCQSWGSFSSCKDQGAAVWMMASKLWAWKGSAGGGDQHAGAGRKALRLGAVGGHPQALQWRIGQDHPAAAAGGQVQPRPAPPRADVQQAVRGRQLEPCGQLVGLRDGGVAVGAPVTTDDSPFDLARDRRGGDPVALLEPGPCL